jgi:hypothetical protein
MYPNFALPVGATVPTEVTPKAAYSALTAADGCTFALRFVKLLMQTLIWFWFNVHVSSPAQHQTSPSLLQAI